MKCKDAGFILLAGGRSVRMQRDKANLRWGSGTFLSEQLDRAHRMNLKGVLLSCGCNMPERELPEIIAVPDVFQNCGPLGGIHACLLQSRWQKNLVLPVDVPQFPDEWGRRLLETAYRTDADIVTLRYGGYLEPLLSVFDRRCTDVLGAALEQGERSVIRILKCMNAVELDYSGDPVFIRNINTPEDYTALLEQLKPT